MSLRFPLLLALTLSAPLTARLSAQEEQPEAVGDVQVLVVPIRDEVGRGTAYMIQKTLREAQARGVSRVVLEIDTPGGEVETSQHIKALLSSEVQGLLTGISGDDIRVTALVKRRAQSAGAYIALACHDLYMAPGSSIGAITPVLLGPGGVQGIADDDVRRKLISALRGDLRSMIERRSDKPGLPLVGEAMVDPDLEIFEVTYEDQDGVQETVIVDRPQLDELKAQRRKITAETAFRTRPLTLTAVEARRIGLSSGTLSRSELIRDEFFVVRPDAVLVYDESWSEEAVAWLDGMKPILFVIGFLLILLELKTPGFAVPGALGVVLLGLAMFSSYLIGLAEFGEILLFFLGIGLIFAEIYLVPGTLFAGLAGLVCVIAGLILSQQSFLVPQNAVQEGILLSNLINMLLLTVLVIVGSILLWRLTPYIPVLNRVLQAPPDESLTGASIQYGKHADADAAKEALVGRHGVAGTDLRPVGSMDLDGERLDVMTMGAYVSKGSPVRIVSVELNQVIVEAVPETDADATGESTPEAADGGQVSIGLLIALWLLGLCFVIAEVFFPSMGILSIFAALSLVASIFLAYTQHDTTTGHWFLVTAAVAVPVVAYFALKMLPHTPFGRILLLSGPDHDSVTGAGAEPGLAQLIGKRGHTLSYLRPSGIARIEGQRVDVITRGEMLEENTPIVVLEVEGNRVVVTRDDKAGTPNAGTPNAGTPN